MTLKITWIGQNGFLLALDDKKLCIDPYLSNSVKDLDGFERLIPIPILPQHLNVEMILCTHDHADHLDEKTIKKTNMKDILYVGPQSCVDHYKAIGIKEEQIIKLDRGESIKFGDATIHGVYAAHTADSIGVIVEYNGINIYLVGDSLYDSELLKAKRYSINVLICPINGKLGNMNYVEAAELAQGLGVQIAVPCHYGMFAENTEDPDKFREELHKRNVGYYQMEFNKTYLVSLEKQPHETIKKIVFSRLSYADIW